MKAILTVLGVVFLIVAAMYFLVPAELVTDLFPGTRNWADAYPRQARHVVRRDRYSPADRRLVYGTEVRDFVPSTMFGLPSAADISQAHEN